MRCLSAGEFSASWCSLGMEGVRGGWMFGTVLLEVYCTASPWLLHGFSMALSICKKQLNFTKRLSTAGTKWFDSWKHVKTSKYSWIFRTFHGSMRPTRMAMRTGSDFWPRLSHCPRALSLRSVFGSRGMFDPVEFRSCLDFRAVHTLPRHDQEHHDRIRWAHCSVELKDVLLAAFNVFIYIDPSWHAWFRFIFQKHCVVHSIYFFRNYAGVICT